MPNPADHWYARHLAPQDKSTRYSTHIVEVYCRCPDIEECSMERYISDVRILKRALMEVLWERDTLRRKMVAINRGNRRHSPD